VIAWGPVGIPRPWTFSADLTSRATWFAGRVRRPGRFVFTPGSRPDDATGGLWCVEGEGLDACVRTVYFALGEDDAGLWDAAPIVVEGTLVQLYHPARGQFRAVLELRLVGARRVR
jgi:hypothetical protein